MNANVCHREDELLDSLGRGFVGPELDAHVVSCRACSELRLVAGAFLEDRREAIADAPVPSAGTMLWRLHMRARRDAEATARGTLLVGQAATLIIAFTLVAAFFGTDVTLGVRDLVAAIRVNTPLLLALATLALTAPIAGWVVARSK